MSPLWRGGRGSRASRRGIWSSRLATLLGTWRLLSAPSLYRWNVAGKSRDLRPGTIATPLSWRISARRLWSSLWRGLGSARRICKWNIRDENEDFWEEKGFWKVVWIGWDQTMVCTCKCGTDCWFEWNVAGDFEIRIIVLLEMYILASSWNILIYDTSESFNR